MRTHGVLPTALLLSTNPYKTAFFTKHLKGLYYLIYVEDCSDAIDWIKNSTIELVLLDYETLDEPLGNFCPHVRKLLGKKNIPIFLISQMIKKTLIDEALQSGITDFIHEPLDADEIYERIAVHFTPSLTKKMKTISRKIKPTPQVPKDAKSFSKKTLLSAKTLKTIIETKNIATPLSVLSIQIDKLEKLLKTLSHQEIKQLVMQLEKLFKASLRKLDFLITEGIGHYLILLPKTSPAAAKIIAEELQKEVSTTSLKIGSSEILITISIGVLSFEKELSDSAKIFTQLESSIAKIKISLDKKQKPGNIVVSK